MAKYVSDQSRDTLFVDGSLDDLLPENSLARAIWSTFEGLDFSRFDTRYRNDAEGRPAIDPRRLAGVWVLGLVRGITSSVCLERMCSTDIEFRWLCGDVRVGKSTLSAFRTRHVSELGDLSTQILAALARSDMLPGEELAVDGTVVRAASSCGSSCSRKKLKSRVRRLSKVIEGALTEPESETRVERREGMKRRQARLEDALVQMSELGLESESHRITVTEPEASVKKLKNGRYAPAHNVQLVTDLSSGAIVSSDVVSESNDQGQLGRQLDRAVEELARVKDRVCRDGCEPNEVKAVTADAGYHDTHDLVALEGRVETFVPDDRQRNRTAPGVSAEFAAARFYYDESNDTMVCPRGETLRRRKLNTLKTSVTYQAPAAACNACKFKPQCCPESRSGRHVNRPLYGHVTDAVARRTKSPRGEIYKRARHVTMEGAFARIIELLNWRRCRTWGRAGAQAEALWRQITHNLMLLLGQWQPLVLKQVPGR